MGADESRTDEDREFAAITEKQIWLEARDLAKIDDLMR
jgi:hypothetical protein